jgi:hypothetical protein
VPTRGCFNDCSRDVLLPCRLWCCLAFIKLFIYMGVKFQVVSSCILSHEFLLSVDMVGLLKSFI